MKCAGSAQSIRKLELSDELVEGASRQDQTWNRIIQQDEALLDWGLQDRKPRILDALKSVEHLEVYFHHVDHMARATNGMEPPKYDEGLRTELCSAFGDLRALEHVRTIKTYASMQIRPVPCNCAGPQMFVFDVDDEAMRHVHAYRVPRVEESFNRDIESPLRHALVRNEEDFREQRRQIFRLRIEASERQASLDCGYKHLERLKRRERRARRQLLAYREGNRDRGLTARRRAHDAVSYKYELAHSLAEEELNQKTSDYKKESTAIGLLSADGEKRLKKLEERWGKMASEGLDLEISDENGDSEISSDSD